jgi:diguanylate cyclase (GGDEF)-like protein
MPALSGSSERADGVGSGPLRARRGVLDEARARARLDSQLLLVRVQTDLAGTTAAVDSIIGTAQEQEWWDVALLGVYARVVGMTTGGQPDGLEACCEQMISLADRTRDPAARALALAARANALGSTRGPRRTLSADGDLAKATVLLETGLGGAFERINAHIECGEAFDTHRLWELEIDQYVAALGVDLSSEHSEARSNPNVAGGQWAIKNNLAEVQCHWVSALYLVGDGPTTLEVAAQSLPIFAAAAASDLPDEWLPDLEALRLLTCALGAQDVAEQARECLDHLEAESPPAGIAHLAIALCERNRRPAAVPAAIEAAIGCLAGSAFVMEYELAISLSVEAEAARLGGDTAGLRFVSHHNAHQWADRISRLNAMLALINAERFRVERETFERDAHVDDLTRLANRRGYHRYLAGFASRDRRQVAVLAMDVDRFKSINDRFGHLAGDDALRRIGAVLATHSRPEDLAARMGGDEFVMVLPGVSLQAATDRASEVITVLGRQGRTSAAGFSEPIDISIGIATGPAERVDVLNKLADEALYQAKSGGGRRAAVAAPFDDDGATIGPSWL